MLGMRPGLEKWFDQETAEFLDTNIDYAVRRIKWQRLIQAQEGVVKVQTDGSIVSPIDPDDIKDAREYLERLRQMRIPL